MNQDILTLLLESPKDNSKGKYTIDVRAVGTIKAEDIVHKFSKTIKKGVKVSICYDDFYQDGRECLAGFTFDKHEALKAKALEI